MRQGSSALDRYQAGRLHVLDAYRLPSDPRRAAEVLAKIIGGDDLAVDWLRSAADWLEDHPVPNPPMPRRAA